MSGFVMVPGWLLAKGPTGNEVLAYCHLASFGTWNPGPGTYEECRPAIATLAERCCMSETNLRRALKGLTDKGALIASGPRYDERGGQLPTVYRVVFGTVSQGVPPVAPPGSASGTPGVPPVAPNQEPSTKNLSSPSVKRGTRIPDDFRPSDEDFKWLREKYAPNGWTEDQKIFCAEQFDNFKDWFASVSGQKGVKVDWSLTWRVWMRKAFRNDYRPGRANNGGRTFSQQNDLYKIAKEKLGKARDELISHLVEDQHMDAGQAFKAGDEWFNAELAKLASSSMETNAGVPYIDGQVVPRDDTKEVTGS